MEQEAQPFLYRNVSGKIAGLIERGVLRPGERVPSVRRLGAQEGVSVSTILQAYTLLESRGYIEARPQSGFYVRSRRESLPPADPRHDSYHQGGFDPSCERFPEIRQHWGGNWPQVGENGRVPS